jgi:hypothetical protein
LLVGTSPRLDDVAAALRKLGVPVAILPSVGVVAVTLRSERVRALLVEHESGRADLDELRSRLASFSPGTRIVFVDQQDRRSAVELASDVIGPHSER